MKPFLDRLYRESNLHHENGDAWTEAEYQALQYEDRELSFDEDLDWSQPTVPF
jgi:hypothetical protein